MLPKPTDIAITAAAADSTILITGTADVTVHATLEGQAPKRPSFTMQAYTGGELRVAGYPQPVVIDLNGLRASENVSILFDHDYKQIVGQATHTLINGSGVQVAGAITADTGAAGSVIEHARNGFKWPVSVGVSARQLQFVEAGKSIDVNGRTFKGPLYVARSGVLREVSFTGVGADEFASAQVAASAAGELPMTFEVWLEAHGFDVATVTEKQKPALMAQFESEVKASPSTASSAAPPAGQTADLEARLTADRAALAAEAERIGKIAELTRDHATIRAQAIRDVWTPERTELAVIRASRPVTREVPRGGLPADVSHAQVIEAALCRRLGLPEAVATRGLDPRAIDLAQSRPFARYSIQQLVRDCIQANGGTASNGPVDDLMIRAAMMSNPNLSPMSQNINAADSFSTLSFTGILSNIANKAMLAAYNAVASVVSQVAFETDTNDFKAFKRYRLTGNGTFQVVGPTGELASTELQDEEYSNQLQTFGRIITLTRQMIINDDLNAFTDIPRLLGRMAALAREENVFTLWLSGVSIVAGKTGETNNFFSTGNGNNLTGAGSALGISALTASTRAFYEQKDVAGKPILIAPRKLMVPPALYALSMQLQRDTTIIATGIPTSAAAIATNSNPWAGSFAPVQCPYLGTAFGLSGASDTAWYQIADPVDTAAVQVAYLNGQRTPIIETAAADFATLGVKYRGYWDFGVAFLDKRAAVRNAGV